VARAKDVIELVDGDLRPEMVLPSAKRRTRPAPTRWLARQPPASTVRDMEGTVLQ